MDLLQKFRFYASIIYYRLIKSKGFRFFDKSAVIHCPLRIDGTENMIIRARVTINYRSWLAALPVQGEDCVLEIGEGTVIGNFNHIYATRKIIIGKKVLTADRVYISDNLHSFEDINVPVMDQKIKQNNAVEIGDGSWIGENVSILGCKIGKNCVIGSNAVVTKDIPDYCIAVGVPAKVIKKYCLESNMWVAV